jgi:hypothetical protein
MYRSRKHWRYSLIPEILALSARALGRARSAAIVLAKIQTSRIFVGYDRDDIVQTGTNPKGVAMKFFLRGILALGLPALLATVAFADNPTPAPATPAKPAAPAAGTAVAGNGGCSSCGSESGSRRRFGLFAKYTPPPGGDRVDHLVARYDATNKCINGFFQKLAGPQVNPSATPVCQKGAPNTQPGTVVFPQHPFARSPRDFFMQD